VIAEGCGRVDRPDQSVRPVTAAELPQLAALCRDHARYEQAEPPPGMDPCVCGHRGEEATPPALATTCELEVYEVQWQTPAWNTAPIQFYDRLGATGKPKIRFSLPISPAPLTQGETCGGRPTDLTDAT
jgi:hypothetical protein